MHILIFGGNGKVGRALQSRLQHHKITAPSRKEFNILLTSLPGFVSTIKPDLIINAAAFNGIENCAHDPGMAYATNAIAPAMMAEAASFLGIPMIHFSTDYVFDGGGGNYTSEICPPQPVTLYSRTKFLSETAVATAWEKTLIFRVSTIYGPEFTGPLSPIAQYLNGQVPKVLEQFCCPTSARLIADAVAHVIDSEAFGKNFGLYHLSTNPGIWRKDFIAYALFGDVAHEYEHELFEFPPGPDQRPRASYLCCNKFQRTFSYKLPSPLEDFAVTFASFMEERRLYARASEVVRPEEGLRVHPTG